MKSISRVKLNLIIHRDLLHKWTDARIETLDGLYKQLSKDGYFKSKFEFKNKLIDTIDEDFSHYPQIESLKEDVEYWYQHSDAQKIKLTITGKDKELLYDLAQALKIDYVDLLNSVSHADFSSLKDFSKNKICGIIAFIQTHIDVADKEWRKASAGSIGYSPQYVLKKIQSKQKIQELYKTLFDMKEQPTSDEKLKRAENIISLVIEMRTAQKEYFASRSQGALHNSKQLERRVDNMLLAYTHQTNPTPEIPFEQ